MKQTCFFLFHIQSGTALFIHTFLRIDIHYEKWCSVRLAHGRAGVCTLNMLIHLMANMSMKYLLVFSNVNVWLRFIDCMFDLSCWRRMTRMTRRVSLELTPWDAFIGFDSAHEWIYICKVYWFNEASEPLACSVLGYEDSMKNFQNTYNTKKIPC